MKALKFEHKFVNEIIEGRKVTTWRLFDDKNLSIGDELNLINRDNGETFGKAIITEILEKKIKDLTKSELNDHDYANTEAMIISHKSYYGDKVDMETDVKIITFKII